MPSLKLGDVTAIAESGGTLTFPTGHITQVLQTVKTDKESIAGNASSSSNPNTFYFIPAQGGSDVWQQSITTTGSNKVLIKVHIQIGNSSTNYSTFYAIFRGVATNTVIGSCTKLAYGTEQSGSDQTQATGMRYDNAGTIDNLSMTWLDSPGAGTHFYKIGWNAEASSTGYINRNTGDNNMAHVPTVPSTLTLMEIQA